VTARQQLRFVAGSDVALVKEIVNLNELGSRLTGMLQGRAEATHAKLEIVELERPAKASLQTHNASHLQMPDPAAVGLACTENT